MTGVRVVRLYPQFRVRHSRRRQSNYDRFMDGDPEKRSVLCDTCERFKLEVIRVGLRWRETRRCVEGMRFSGERVECPRYIREVGCDDLD